MSKEWPKRVFIALNPPKRTRKKLAGLEEKWGWLPCRWVERENLHVTLAFLGNTGRRDLKKVKKITRKVAEESRPFTLSLEKAVYGPPGRKPPSLIWAEGERNNQITTLKKELDRLLEKHLDYQAPKRKYLPHVTLARIKKMRWRRLESEKRKSIRTKIDLSFRAESAEIMESQLKSSGPEYKIIRSFSFKNGKT